MNLAILSASAAVFVFAKWRPSEAAAFGSWLTTGTDIVLRVIHTWPKLTHDHNDLIPVILGAVTIVLGVHFLELLGWE